MRRIIMALLLVVVLCGTAGAQNAPNWYPKYYLWGMNWSISVPSGTTKDFIDQESLRGFGVTARKFVKENLSIGFSFSWHVMNGDWVGLAQVDEADMYGQQRRFLNSFPLLFTSHFYLGQYGNLRPYAGLGAGPYIVEERIELGLYASQSTEWHLGVAPEVGLIFPAAGILGYVSAVYNYAWEAGDQAEVSYWSINIGIGLK